MSEEGKNHPFLEVAATAAALPRGSAFHQKFTCGSCGSRQTMEQPNVMYKTGKCEECGALTDIVAAGCNLLVIIGISPQD